MPYDLVGDDSDYGSIGYDEFGADSLVESLISGDGTSEIVGADELIGAARRRGRGQQRGQVAGGGKRVVHNELSRARRYPIGFLPTTVAASSSASITASPQNLFKPTRLVIPSDICFDFGVADVKVGTQSQLVQSVEIPAAIFSEVAIDTGVSFDTAEIGNQLSVSVRNKTAGGIEFTAAALGTIAK